MIQVIEEMNNIVKGNGDSEKLKSLLETYVQNRAKEEESDLISIRRSAAAPFSFCNRLINDLRGVIKVHLPVKIKNCIGIQVKY